jgi:hypothetical protein
LLGIGRYRVEVENPGFKRVVKENVEVRVSDRLQIDIAMEVGAVSESIVVAEATPLLQTAEASLGQLIDSRRVDELPIAHGNPYHLIALSPGATFEGDPKLNRPYDPTHIVAYAMDGTKNNTSDITLDGVANTALASSGSSNNSVTASYVPPTDAIQEFKVQTAAFDAKVGQTSGGLVNIVLKQGGNTPHGTAYYSGRRPAWNANDFFANRAGIPQGDFTYSREGGSATGPVVVPGLYNGHDKTFFMGAMEWIHDVNPRGQAPWTVPTDAQRKGDLSDLLALGSKDQIYNPFSRTGPVSGRYTAQPFVGNIIPTTLLDPVAQHVLSNIPGPLVAGNPGDHTNNYPVPNTPEDNRFSTYIGRIDQILSDKHHFFLRADVNDRDALSKDWFNSAASGQKQDYGARGASFDDVYTFTPTFLMNVRYGYNRYVRLTEPERGRGFDLTTLGFPAAFNNAIDPTLREFSRFRVKGYFETNNIGEDRNMDTHSLVTAFTKAYRSHTFEFGGEFRAYRQDRYNLNTQTSGFFDFDETWTRGPQDNSSVSPLGQGLASFLLGIPNTGSLISRNASMAEQSTAWMFYAQDNWRVSRKLSVNFGLRYELEGPITERYNRSVRQLDPTTPWTQNTAVQAAYAKTYAASPTPELPVSAFALRGGLTFAGVGGNPNTLWNSDVNNFAPRIGIAYTADSKTVIRSGFGMFFSPLGLRRTDVLQAGFSRTTALIPTNDQKTFVGTLSNPFPNGILDPVGTSLGIQTEAGNDITFFNPTIQAPYMARWQFSLQRQLARDTMLEVAYVGNKGMKLESDTATPSTTNQVSINAYRDLNALPDQYLSTSATRDAANIATSNYLGASLSPNPFNGLDNLGKYSTATTIARSQLLLPYPQFGKVMTTTNDGASWYHAMQVRFEHRLSHNLTLNSGYTWSKFMEKLDRLNPADPLPWRGLSQADHTHRFVTSWIYELPFGKSQPLFARANRLVDGFIGGWQIQGIYTYQTGAPLTWLDATFTGDPNGIATNTRNIDQWFNTSAGFLKDSTLKPQNHLRTWPLRLSSLRNDGINNWDLSLSKRVLLAERVSLRIEGEFLNAMNHARFKAPVTDPYSTTFGQVTDTASFPRIVQAGIKLAF